MNLKGTMQKLTKKFLKDVEAVSPIIATLMLVLVTVGAAGAFYVWQAGWQEDVTGGITDGGVDTAQVLKIAGSTTVYPFSIAAQPYFEDNYDIKLSISAGGSGFGVQGAGTGILDIGSSSSALDADDHAAYPDLDKDGEKDFGEYLVETQVAWDAVVVIIDAGNTHGITNINASVLFDIYNINGNTGDFTGNLSGITDDDTDGSVSWDEIGGTGSEEIAIYDRADHSGTEETFSKKMIKAGKANLEDAGINAIHANGNPELLAAVAADPDGIGFNAYGYAAASTDVTMLVFESFDGEEADPKDTGFAADVREGALGSAEGVRPLMYITVGEPQDTAKAYLDYVLLQNVNQQVCEDAGYISLYAE